jgi:hypothetical protein
MNGSPNLILMAARADTANTYVDPTEAAAYLNVTQQAFGSLVKEYGAGRFHVGGIKGQIAYRLSDLDAIKRGLLKAKTANSDHAST